VEDLPHSWYEFVVLGKNNQGLGERSDSKRLLFGAKVPDSPEPPEALQASDSSVTLTWAAALKDGGLPVTSFRIEVRVEGTNYDNRGFVVGNQDSIVVDQLMAGTKYRFRVAALNAVGWGKPSQESELVLTLQNKERKKMIWVIVGISFLTAIGMTILSSICYYIWVSFKGPSAQYMQLSTLGEDTIGDDEEIDDRVDSIFEDADEADFEQDQGKAIGQGVAPDYSQM